ncbi:MAG: hypothetical protein AAGI27_00645 [Pseudomonadota bacterium]
MQRRISVDLVAMLTDIFAFRYVDVPMWDAFTARDRRLIIQAWRLVNEDIFPMGYQDKETDATNARWKSLNDKLSTELGLKELAKRHDGYYREYLGNRNWVNFTRSWRMMCEQYVCADFDGSGSADEFIKNRLSFIEIAFREKEQAIAARRKREITSADVLISKLLAQEKVQKPMSDRSRVLADLLDTEERFQVSVDELNERFRQAGYKLNYHNGFIQRSVDSQVEAQIETPFWALVADEKWMNVETDMATAIDLRDTGGRDPAWHAAKALESTIKIISDERDWTHGGERGASNYIDNLASTKNGRFLDAWESEILKQFFLKLRNPFGHGAGSADMPKLTDQQTNWSIEFCMAWIKSLIERL